MIMWLPVYAVFLMPAEMHDAKLNDQEFGRFRFWNALSITEREELIAAALAYFPEVMGASQTKYQRFAEWLASRKGILCTNIRDAFGAGGKKTVSCNGLTIRDAPKVLTTLFNNGSKVREILAKVSARELALYYQVKIQQIEGIGCTTAWIGNASLALEETLEGHPDSGKLRALVKKIAGV
jgi:hypothetical protein